MRMGEIHRVQKETKRRNIETRYMPDTIFNLFILLRYFSSYSSHIHSQVFPRTSTVCRLPNIFIIDYQKIDRLSLNVS